MRWLRPLHIRLSGEKPVDGTVAGLGSETGTATRLETSLKEGC